MRAVIYNFVGGAGGDGLAARTYNADHRRDKMDKMKIKPGLSTILKDIVHVRLDDFYEAIMELPANDFYVTHHLNLLNPDQLESVASNFEIINIDDNHAHRETFLLTFFKNEMRRTVGTYVLTVGKKVYTFTSDEPRSAVDMWNELSGNDFPEDLPARVACMLDEYSRGKGLFYEHHRAWHDVKYPGKYIRYERKPSLGTYYMHGYYWDLDSLRAKMESYPPN